MALRNADRVLDTSTTTGTGNFTVSGTAASSYITFSQIPSIATNDTFWYCIAHTTANEYETGLATWQGSNVFARTTVYQSSNSGALVNFSAGTKNCMVVLPATYSPALALLEQHTASSSASLTFTSWYSSTYDEYMVEFVNMLPATSGAALQMTVSTDGGSSYDTSGIYAWSGFRNSQLGTAVTGNNSGTSFDIACAAGQTNTTNTGGICATMKIFGPASGMHTRFLWNFTSNDGTGNSSVNGYGGCSYASTTAINAFKLAFSSGNIASGTMRVYGVSKGS